MASTRDENKSPLQTLPAEIRNDIFALALTEPSPLAVCTDDYPLPDPDDGPAGSPPRPAPKLFYALTRPRPEFLALQAKYSRGIDFEIGKRGLWLLWLAQLEKRPAVPALALTCRQFFGEALPVFYAVNEFVLSEIYSELWTTAWFGSLKRLAGLEVQMQHAEVKKRTMQVEYVCISVTTKVEWYGGGGLTEGEGKIRISRDIASGRLLLTTGGLFKDRNLCMCALRDYADQLRGEECVEEVVDLFMEEFYREVVPLPKSERWLPERCGRCGGREWETWEMYRARTGNTRAMPPVVAVSRGERREEDWRERGLKQGDIRDYFAKLSVE